MRLIKRAAQIWQDWFGVKYRFHPLFSIMMLISVLTGYFVEMATLFVIVFIHELGHVAAAKQFGWRVKEVKLLPFGGVAVVDELASVPVREDVIVALSGPLQNVWMTLLAYPLTVYGIIPAEWGLYFMEANILIALFNLIPVMPLDGGKILQALLSSWLPYQRTIRAAAWIGLLFSLGMIVAAFLHLLWGSGGIQLNFLMIGLFLFFSNWYDLRGTPFHFMRFLVHREALFRRLLHKGTLAQPIVVGGRRRVSDIVRMFMREKYHLIYLLDEYGMIRKVIPEQRVLETYFDETKRGSPMEELFL
ncbi:M50 family metallopeptidase [Paenibacillus silviterrae]|uniref:M50 family metallopeptidase n=1 Tax=Paenibacillus silviterrae TaxID=3242194 RepID=UPI0032B1F5FB